MRRLFAPVALTLACGAPGAGMGEVGTGDGSASDAGEGGASSGATATSDTGATTDGTGSTGGTTDAGTTGDGDAGDGDGDGGTTGGENPDNWAFDDVYGVPNLDDDDLDGSADWYDVLTAADDDISVLTIPSEALPAGATVALALTGATTGVRIWHEGVVVLGDDVGGPAIAAELDPQGGELVLEIEFSDYLAEASLRLDRMSGGTVQRTDDVRLLASPLILNHHLQPAEHVYITDVNGNWAFQQGYESRIGSTRFTAVPGSAVGWDVWMQDENEFGTSIAPGPSGSIRLDTVIDSIRDRGLDAFAEGFLVGPDVIAATWGTPGQETTYDSFGNLEISPPVTVGGVEFPFGRIYYGQGMHPGLTTFLESQRVQDPFAVDTSWLRVGHVDEFSAFIPDPSSPKGFKLLFADTTAGYALLDSMSPTMSLPQYQWDYGYATVGAMAGDSWLRALNQDIQADQLEPILNQFKATLDLTEADVIRIPSVFESISGGDVALIPGMVNLTVVNFAGETPMLFVPDPFMRSNPGSAGGDAFIAAFDALMPAGFDVVYLDNWDTYHLALGEVHCGTNITRTPTTQWWTDALHLIGP